MSRKLVVIAFLGLMGPSAHSAFAGGNVAIIDSQPVFGQAAEWCAFLEQHGHPCTIFPVSGPTGPLDAFDVVVDMSQEWADATGMLADVMRAGKTVITTNAAPLALGINSDPIVQAWIGANAYTSGTGRLVSKVRDPILGTIPVGTTLDDCATSLCTAVRDTTGHPQATVVATFVQTPGLDPIGILRNSWEEGFSIFLTSGFVLGSDGPGDEIILNAIRIRGLIPTLGDWGVLVLTISLAIAGVLILRRRTSTSASSLPRAATLLLFVLCAPTGVRADVTSTQENEVTSLRLGAGQPFHDTDGTVSDLRSVAIPDSTGIVVLWSESDPPAAARPFYAISLDGIQVQEVRATSYSLNLRHGRFDPAIETPAVPESLSPASTSELYLVQFITQPLPAYRKAVEAQGATLHDFIPSHAYVARIPTAARDAVATLPFVRAVTPYHPAFKLEPMLVAEVTQPPPPQEARNFNIRVLEPSSKAVLVERISEIGGGVASQDAGKRLFTATLTLEQLLTVARYDEVLFMDRWSPLQPQMNNVRAVTGTNYVGDTAGYQRTGVRGEVFDSGFNTEHIGFDYHPLVIHGTEPSSGEHGAATSGIIFASGAPNDYSPGLIFRGQGIIADWDSVGLQNGPSRYAHTGELVDPNLSYKAVFQSTSGCGDYIDIYTTDSAELDEIFFDFDLVHCQAQGNSSSQNSCPQAWAKNTISVGGVRHSDDANPDNDHWHGDGLDASIGPASDGRVKPDLSHFYDNIYTTWCCGYTTFWPYFDGTSAATPIVCGLVGLLMEMWADDSDDDGKNIFGVPVPVCNPATENCVFKRRPHASTARAMMINTARQYDWINGPTPNQDLDRNKQGWGVPNIGDLYDLRNKMLIVDESCVLPQFGALYATVKVYADEPAFKATLVYKDPPACPSSTLALVNDLNLKVTSPSAATYRGNHGLSSALWSTTGAGNDNINPVENVFVQNPEAGLWTIEVKAADINQDGHVQTSGEPYDVDFALVVSGVLPAGECQLPGNTIIVTDRADCLSQSGTYDGDAVVCDTCPNCQ